MPALPLLLALLVLRDAPAAPPPEPASAEADQPYPPGAPHDDYGLVSWCAGALGGYLELHDKVLPEVTRIEGAFRRPGTTLAQDMKVYADMQKEGHDDMKAFARAMQAAEKASLKPIRDQGADAMQRGHANWAAAAAMPVRAVAQQWMGWSLPARCRPTAAALEARAKLLGATFQANAPPEPSVPPAGDPPSSSEAAPSR